MLLRFTTSGLGVKRCKDLWAAFLIVLKLEEMLSRLLSLCILSLLTCAVRLF